MNAPTSADATQVAGTHYNTMAIQPWNFIAVNEKQIGFFEGTIISYISRWRRKGGVEDLRKIRHYVDKMIELAVKFGWPHTELTDAQVAELLGPPTDTREALKHALRSIDTVWEERYRGNGGVPCSDTARVPTSDDAAIERAVEATQQITEALKTCTAIREGVTGKPYPLHTALRTTIKHTENSLVTALRNLQAFRDIVREHNAHE